MEEKSRFETTRG